MQLVTLLSMVFAISHTFLSNDKGKWTPTNSMSEKHRWLNSFKSIVLITNIELKPLETPKEVLNSETDHCYVASLNFS